MKWKFIVLSSVIFSGFMFMLNTLASLGLLTSSNYSDCSRFDGSIVVDNITNWTKRDYCYFSLAIKEGNDSLCDKIKTGKETCYENFDQTDIDPIACSKVDNLNTRDTCYMYDAENEHDPSICAKISSNDTKDSCYLTVALTEKNTGICTNISNPGAAQQCEAAVRQI